MSEISDLENACPSIYSDIYDCLNDLCLNMCENMTEEEFYKEYIIEKDGLDNMLEVMTIEDSAGLIDDWLSDKKADRRKEMLDGYEFNIMNL